MLSMEKNIEKQLIVRAYEPDMNAVKQTARQLANMQDVSLNLYGQAGEVLIVISARAFAAAAATELTENVAEQFELALGDAAYGRGKSNLAHFAAGELIQSESVLAAADSATGALLDEEFSKTKRGEHVYDFGEDSFHDTRIAAKIQNAERRYADGEDPAQSAAARAAAAAKYGRAEFGVAIVGLGSEDDVYAAVSYKKYVYIRVFPNEPGVEKKAALAALNTVRLLAQGKEDKKARVFRENTDFDWEQPVRRRGGGANVVPIIALALLLIALGIACWYFFTHFTLGGEDGSLPADGRVSSSAAGSNTGTESLLSPDSGSGTTMPEENSDTQTVPDTDGEENSSESQDTSEPSASEPDTNTSQSNSGVVHPFG